VNDGLKSTETPSSAQKRKAGEANEENDNAAKKAKTGRTSVSADDSDPDSAEPSDEDG
jgi:nuclear transcription factor Y alpha